MYRNEVSLSILQLQRRPPVDFQHTSLAYSELYLGLACVFRRFEIALFETTKRDVEIVHDFFIGQVEMDSKGIRAKIVGEMKN
jgi:hypothetical protein